MKASTCVLLVSLSACRVLEGGREEEWEGGRERGREREEGGLHSCVHPPMAYTHTVMHLPAHSSSQSSLHSHKGVHPRDVDGSQ